MSEDLRHKIATEDEFIEGNPIITEIKGVEVAVYNFDGDYHAILNNCPHQNGPLCEGPMSDTLSVAEDYWTLELQEDDYIVACPWHNWKFNIESGRHVKNPNIGVPTFDVEVDGDEVFVSL
jgi:nitrite reductase/ring-hydroxylating ferredoxin subunit